MRNFFIFLAVFFSFAGFSQTTVNYTASNADIANQDRGFWHYSSSGSGATYNLLNQATMTSWRTTENITVVYRYFYLMNFLSSPISAAYLSNMQTDFTRARNAGVKIVVRFAYSNNSNASTIKECPKALMLQHIAQFTPVLQANSDVITFLQFGNIGAYGEGYYTTQVAEFGNQGNINATQWANRKQVFEALANTLPDKFVLVRTPKMKKQMYGNTPTQLSEAYNGSYKSRIGQFNDCALADPTDYGTYETPADITWLEQDSKFVPICGELCNPNPPRSECVSAQEELNRLNWSMVNRDYNTDVIDAFISDGCYNDIKKNLGYRLSLTSSTFPSSVNQGVDFNFTLNITNSGYASPFNKRDCYLVFRNTVSNVEIKKKLSVDLRYWDSTHIISESVLNDLPIGDYAIFLFMPDFSANLETIPAYSIRLANNGMWEATTGYNALNQTITVSSPLACSTSTTWNGTSWSNGVPTVNSNAIINAPYTVLSGQGFDCCNLTVNSNLTINNNGFITVLNDIVVIPAGNLTVRSGGKLIPVSDTSTSTGNVTVERTTTPLKQYDYTYFGSPVSETIEDGFPLSTWQSGYIFGATTQNFYDVETSYNGAFISAVSDMQDDSGDFWQNATGLMQPGKGYAAMVKIGGTYPRTETVSFTGTLNTGIITTPLYFSQNTANLNDDFNLVSVPFSSSIYAPQFINDNLDRISGTVYLWSHTGSLSSSYPGLVVLNFIGADYAYLNELGGTASSFGGKVPSDYLGSLQGFFVEAEAELPLKFLPATMAAGYANSTGSVFFRNAQTPPDNKKIWLSIKNNNNLYSQTLIGYTDNTTLEYDKGWDAPLTDVRTPLKLYSFGSDQKLKIQSRPTWNAYDVVDLGMSFAVADNYTISLDSLVGNISVFIRDNGVVHPLPYTFFSEEGEFNSRFEVVYSNELSLNQWLLSKVVAYTIPVKDGVLEINLVDSDYYKYEIRNVLGQKMEFRREKNKFYIEKFSMGVYYLKIMDGRDRKIIRFIVGN